VRCAAPPAARPAHHVRRSGVGVRRGVACFGRLEGNAVGVAAAAWRRGVVHDLLPARRQSRPLVGVEPSCRTAERAALGRVAEGLGAIRGPGCRACVRRVGEGVTRAGSGHGCAVGDVDRVATGGVGGDVETLATDRMRRGRRHMAEVHRVRGAGHRRRCVTARRRPSHRAHGEGERRVDRDRRRDLSDGHEIPGLNRGGPVGGGLVAQLAAGVGPGPPAVDELGR
jgi:hypothetical protein